jgi:hypothetical protein
MSTPDSTPATAPDATPTDAAPAETAALETAAAPETVEPTVDTPAPMSKADIDAAAASAFDTGLEAAVDESAPKTAADVAAQAKAAETTAAATPATPAAPAAKVPDADTDQAVRDLGLKGKAEVRFREMAGTIKEVAPLREAFAKHGITDPAKVEELVQNSARAVEWETTVLASTATPEQFGSALNVIKAMNSGDPRVMNIAFDSLLNEVSALGKKLGREVPGLIDPLEVHDDLRGEVESGDITRKRALEIAAQRASAARTAEVSTEQQQAAAHQQAMSEAIGNVTALNDKLKASDPDFARKLPFLQPALDTIRANLHPSQWVAAIERAYHQLPALPVAAPVVASKPAISHMPVRTGGSGVPLQPKPRTDLEAFDMGLQSLGG